MTQNIRKHKLRLRIVLCVGCLLFGLFVTKLSTTAKSGSPYYIKVNKQQNVVTVYEKDKDGKYTNPVKAMTCSTGKDTPLGTYKTKAKYRWKLLMGDVWGQYSTRIVGGILFHSVWYYKMDPSTLSATQYNKLGTAASHGCVRLTVADAKWIYDNCPIGTTVEIYNSKDPGPLGKPTTLKLPTNAGWDPTDPSDNNPYKEKNPELKGVKDKTVEWGSKVDLLAGVKATSITGTDITSDIIVEGKVDVNTAGKYKIKYSIKDASGKTTKKTITITVKENTEPPRITGVTDKYASVDTVINRSFALKGVSAYQANKKLPASDIKVKITKKSEDVYTIDYSVKTSNKKTAKAQATVYVDRTPPVIEGIYFRELTLKQLKAGKDEIKKLALKGIKVTDNYAKISVDKVKVTVKAIEDYAYAVTYEVSDDVGNTTSETVQFTYFAGVRIEGVANYTGIPAGTEITEEYVKQGITAIDSDNQECTDQITVKITTEDKIKYKVIYSIADKDGKVISIVSYLTVNGDPLPVDETKGDNTDGTTNNNEDSSQTETSNSSNNAKNK